MIVLTPVQVRQARKLRKEGLSWSAIARQIGTTDDAVRRKIDLKFIERDKQRSQHHRDRKNPIPTGHAVSPFRPTREEFLAAQKLIPVDTRDLTARLLGDPLPGRRALDMRGAK